jgi:hypothetical protein
VDPLRPPGPLLEPSRAQGGDDRGER